MAFSMGTNWLHSQGFWFRPKRVVYCVTWEQVKLLELLEKLKFISDLKIPYTSEPDGKFRITYAEAIE